MQKEAIRDAANLPSIRSLVRAVDFEGRSLHSINDLTNDQIYALFELARALEPFHRSSVELLRGSVMVTLFFQPSTRTRMSFETAMHRLGGAVVTEANPLVSSSAAKEESLADTMRTISKYANVIVLRHPDDAAAREGASYAEAPVINGGWGDWEHPTQALLDLYTLWRTHGSVEGAKVVVATPDMVHARTGHSMAYGLARLGAEVTLASRKDYRAPEEIIEGLRRVAGDNVREVFDLDQDGFNDLISEMDLVYLPGCSAPKGEAAEEFKKMMDEYFVRLETLERVRESEGRIIRVTHTLPRRPGEMDLRIDDTPYQQYFEAIAYSVAIRMALVAAIVGA